MGGRRLARLSENLRATKPRFTRCPKRFFGALSPHSRNFFSQRLRARAEHADDAAFAKACELRRLSLHPRLHYAQKFAAKIPEDGTGRQNRHGGDHRHHTVRRGDLSALSPGSRTFADEIRTPEQRLFPEPQSTNAGPGAIFYLAKRGQDLSRRSRAKADHRVQLLSRARRQDLRRMSRARLQCRARLTPLLLHAARRPDVGDVARTRRIR